MQLSNRTIYLVKYLFKISLICFVLFNLIITAVNTLPQDVLFFFTSDAIENLLCICISYLIYYQITRFNFLWKKLSLILLFIVLLSVLAYLKDLRIHTTITLKDSFDYFTNFLGRSLLFYLLYYAFDQLGSLNKYNELKKELYHTKKQLLRNQLHPHFLFNAFNSLYSLSLKNKPETSDYILKLSSMMRYLTDETYLENVSLAKELDFIYKYIDIEKIRFGEKSNINITIDGNKVQNQIIAPFILITLVENAFKHGFYTNDKNAYVNIVLTLNDKELKFYVENSISKKQHFQENNRDGKGLDNLKKRLKLIYKKSALLEINKTQNKFISTLTINLNEI